MEATDTQRTNKMGAKRNKNQKKIKGNELKKQKRCLHTNRTHYKSVWNEAEMRPYLAFYRNILCVCIWTCSTDNGRTREKIPFPLSEILGLSPATWYRSSNVVFVSFRFYMFSSTFTWSFVSFSIWFALSFFRIRSIFLASRLFFSICRFDFLSLCSIFQKAKIHF